MSLDAGRLKFALYRFRELHRAQQSLDRSSAANAELTPRGPGRGGRHTTRDARHSRDAEYRDRCERLLIPLLCELFHLREIE